nr:unnamed protein product [Digitaria exilis]
MDMPVTIATSIRTKLSKLTARDLHQPSHDPKWSITMADMLTSAAVLRPPSGRFWESDSDSECEDLGDAEVLRPALSSSPAPLPMASTVRAASTIELRQTAPVSSLRRAKPPWRTVWKGPLPSARAAPLATLGDYLPPAFRATGVKVAAAAKIEIHDLVVSPVQKLDVRECCNTGPAQLKRGSSPYGLAIRSGCHTSTHKPTPPQTCTHRPPPLQTTSISTCRRRHLVNVAVPQHLLSSTPYRDALMAGRGPSFRRRGQGGRGPQGGRAAPAAGQPRATGDQGDSARGRGALAQRGRGAAVLPRHDDGGSKTTGDRGTFARDARHGRGHGRGDRDNTGGGGTQGAAAGEQELPHRGRAEDAIHDALHGDEEGGLAPTPLLSSAQDAGAPEQFTAGGPATATVPLHAAEGEPVDAGELAVDVVTPAAAAGGDVSLPTAGAPTQIAAGDLATVTAPLCVREGETVDAGDSNVDTLEGTPSPLGTSSAAVAVGSVSLPTELEEVDADAEEDSVAGRVPPVEP